MRQIFHFSIGEQRCIFKQNGPELSRKEGPQIKTPQKKPSQEEVLKDITDDLIAAAGKTLDKAPSLPPVPKPKGKRDEKPRELPEAMKDTETQLREKILGYLEALHSQKATWPEILNFLKDEYGITQQEIDGALINKSTPDKKIADAVARLIMEKASDLGIATEETNNGG